MFGEPGGGGWGAEEKGCVCVFGEPGGGGVYRVGQGIGYRPRNSLVRALPLTWEDRRSRNRHWAIARPWQLKCKAATCVLRYLVAVSTAVRWWRWCRASCPQMSVDIIIGDKLRPMREHGSVLLYVHRNRKARVVRTESPGRPPRLSHSSAWTLTAVRNKVLYKDFRVRKATQGRPEQLSNKWDVTMHPDMGAQLHLPQSPQSSGAVWESRWPPSWAVRPNEPSGFRGREDLLNHASALVTTTDLSLICQLTSEDIKHHFIITLSPGRSSSLLGCAPVTVCP